MPEFLEQEVMVDKVPDNSYFNVMISPLIPLPLSGVIFYQGESNSGSPTGYAEKINVCFNAWRNYMGS